jgi:hypothetical protein
MESPVADTPGAALYVGCSPSLLLQYRTTDVARVRRGEEPEGPRWHTVGSRVVYLRADLDEWLTQNLKPFGKTARGRKPAGDGEVIR